MTKTIEYNLNQMVRIRLTDFGRECMRRNHDRLYANHKNPPDPLPVKEDADGWSEWQLWCVMEEFGPYIHNGMNNPFETTIRLIEEPIAENVEAEVVEVE